MNERRESRLICAVLRQEGGLADHVIAAAAEDAQRRGLRVVGVLQYLEHRPGRRKCDMGLVDISSGIRIGISEDRGNEARGCRLNAGALAAAAAQLLSQIELGADLLVLNKFGKAEAEGGGMRDVIAAAIVADIPVLLGVSESMVETLQDFADDYCQVVDPRKVQPLIMARNWLPDDTAA